MKQTTKAKLAAGVSILCLPLCGAWSVAALADDVQNDEVRYTGGAAYSARAAEVISYAFKTVVENISTANDTPLYFNNLGLAEACGPVSGAIIVGFYDKYYNDLIPGWSSAYSAGRYKVQDAKYVPELIQTLYDSMSTNIAGPGVSENEFKSGLSSYVNGNGYTISYTSIYNNRTFDNAMFKAAIKSNDLAIILATPDTVYNITSENGVDRLNAIKVNGNHIMVAYGYYEVQYVLSNGSTRTDAYYRVIMGDDDIVTGLYKAGSSIRGAYALSIGN